MPRHSCIRALLAFLLVASAASATVIVPMPDEALVGQSDLIATGVVEHVRPVTTADGAVETWASIRVIDTLKGSGHGGRIVMRQPGGRVGTRSVTVFGTTAFASDEAVLVFVRREVGERAGIGGRSGTGCDGGARRIDGEPVRAECHANRPMATTWRAAHEGPCAA